MKRNFGFTPYEGNGKYGFISYKSEDEKLVAPYAKALHDRGVKLWYDYGIPAGEDWFETISQKIVESSFMIVFVTQKIFHSSVIQIEIKTAEMWDIPVVPVFIENLNRGAIPKKSASLLAKLSLKQGVDAAWRMSVNETADSIYELIAPMLDSDTEEKIRQRGRLLERQVSLTPDVNDSPMVQSALSEVKAEEKISSPPVKNPDTSINQTSKPESVPQKEQIKIPSVNSSSEQKGPKVVPSSVGRLDFSSTSVKYSVLIIFVITLIGILLVAGNMAQNKQSVNSKGNSYYDDSSEKFEYEFIDDNKIKITGLKDDTASSSTLVIPDKIYNYPVTEISMDVFFRYPTLKEIVVSDKSLYFCGVDGVLFNKDGTKLIRFPQDSEMTSYEIPNTVISIGYDAFSCCEELTQIIIPDSVTNIEYAAFNECIGLTEIVIPDSVTEIEEDVFFGCSQLTQVSIPKSVRKIEGCPFLECHKLKKITVDDGNNDYSDINGILYNKNRTELIRCPSQYNGTKISIPNSVQIIGKRAFAQCTNLKNIYIPNSVWKIGDDAFSDCVKLVAIDLPNSVNSPGSNLFRNCTNISRIRMTPSVFTLDLNLFDDCSGLRELIIPEPNSITGYGFGVGGNEKKEPFEKCKNLTLYGGPTAKDLAEQYHLPFVAQ